MVLGLVLVLDGFKDPLRGLSGRCMLASCLGSGLFSRWLWVGRLRFSRIAGLGALVLVLDCCPNINIIELFIYFQCFWGLMVVQKLVLF